METKRLIPYSVHLPEDVYNKLKEAAGNRKASALVRDAITLIVDGDDEFNGGYNKAVRDVISVIHDNQWCKVIGVGGQPLAELLEEILSQMIVQQNVKGKSNGNKKTKG
jgi:superfamily II helicase